MALTLHYHPLSSYCQKVLVAIDELGVAVDAQVVNLGDPAAHDAFLRLWPTGKIPLLVDDGTAVPESSIMIEHLQRRHAQQAALVPHDARQALEVRLWDRLLDQYVMNPMQAIIAQRLRPEAGRDATATASAHAVLAMAYRMLDERMAGRDWLAGDAFTLADCAAAPALFYAVTLAPIPGDQPHLAAYFERLVARPSVRRVIAQARPFFQFYPGREGLAARFLAD